MNYWHKACEECVLDGDCLLQNNYDVDDCQDVKNYERQKDLEDYERN